MRRSVSQRGAACDWTRAKTSRGDGPFLGGLRRAHAAYGQALGITEVKGTLPPPPQIREAREAVLEDIRFYAAQIVGSVSRKDPASEETAERLLRPIAEWPTRRTSAGSGAAAASGASGVGDGAPTPLVMAQSD